MKIIDMQDGFIAVDHIVAVSGNAQLLIYTSDGSCHGFMFDSKEHTKDCIRKLKSFLRSTNSMEDFFSISEQSGYISCIW